MTIKPIEQSLTDEEDMLINSLTEEFTWKAIIGYLQSSTSISSNNKDDNNMYFKQLLQDVSPRRIY